MPATPKTMYAQAGIGSRTLDLRRPTSQASCYAEVPVWEQEDFIAMSIGLSESELLKEIKLSSGSFQKGDEIRKAIARAIEKNNEALEHDIRRLLAARQRNGKA